MATTASIQVTSPATGEELGEVAISSPTEIDAAVRAARAAQPMLEDMTVHERAALLHRAADIVDARLDDLARELALEQGKPLHTEAVEEIEETAGNLRMAAEDVKRMDTAVIPSERRGKVVFTFRKPNGVFAMITPWNFPMMIPSELIAPALATGNSVILKPSEFTPLSGARLVEILTEAGLPEGAIGIVHGAREAGETLVTHPGVDAIGFVGSHGTGEAIVRAAGMKRTLIEASGNGPQIVLADADLGAAATAAVEGAAYLAGQVCVATERVLVEEPAHAEFVELVLARGRRAAGFPTDLYYEMTVVDAVTPETLLFREESFGPVLPITTFRSDDEAIALANDSHLGLQAAVFTSSLRRAFRFVNEIRAGSIQVNETTGYWEGRPPFGGAAGTKTGWGRIQLEDFTDLRTATIDYLNTPDE
jgi:acyl-CoA reductase-like NAD-dependent aldehyde dehydrogenase